MAIHPPRPPQHECPTSDHQPLNSNHQVQSNHLSKSTTIHINVYDLLPPSPLATILYTLGLPLVHTSLFIPALNLEYSYGCLMGGSDQTGVYATSSSSPHLYPPAGTRFLRSIKLGSVNMSGKECGEVVGKMGKEWKGREYDLLGRNCNHFVEAAVEALFEGRGKVGVPGWVNRAARWAKWMPCLVPAEWLADEEEDEESVKEEEDGRVLGNGELLKGYRDEEEAVESTPAPTTNSPDTIHDEADDTFPLLTSPPLRPLSALPEPDSIRHIERRSSEAGDRRLNSGAGGRELGGRRRSSAATNDTTFSGKPRRRSGTLDAEGRPLPLSEIVPTEPPALPSRDEEGAVT